MSPRVGIIGAGWYGILTAKTYLQVDPSIDLTVLEEEETLGGTWCAARIFPGLLANHAVGAYEYADKQMSHDGLAEHGYIPAENIHAYLTAYAREWGVYDRIRFRTAVERVHRHEDSRRWVVHLHLLDSSTSTHGAGAGSSGAPQREEVVVFDKVVLATGLSSAPCMPDLDTTALGAPGAVVHSKDLGGAGAAMARLGSAAVTVYGGGKSALDAVALALRSGSGDGNRKRRVINWVVRASGAGPGAFVPPLVLGGKLPYDVVATRLASKLHPSIYTARAGEWWWRFLHSGESRVGSWLLWAYHGLSSRKVLSWARYDENENLAKMKPLVMDRGLFWVNQPTSIVVQPEPLEAIRSGEVVKIYRKDITALSESNVILDDGSSLRTDLLICATGYQIAPTIFSPSDAAELGLPVPVSHALPPAEAAKWSRLDAEADAEICRLFPRLASPPTSTSSSTHTSHRLYRTVLPPGLLRANDRSFVVVGAIATAATGIVAEAVALWAVAWLTGHLELTGSGSGCGTSGVDGAEREIALGNAFKARRYLTLGRRTPTVMFEWLALVDEMLLELGVNPRRKASWVKEWFEPYYPRDYAGMVDEWKASRGL